MSVCFINEDIELNLISNNDLEKNILKVDNTKEIFSEVYESEINGKKVVFEKIDTINNLPVVTVDFIREDKLFTCEAVFVESDENSLEINEDNLIFLRDIKNEKNNIKNLNQTISEELSTGDLKTETKLQIQHTYDEKIQEYENKKFTFLEDLEQQFNLKIDSFKNDIEKKLDLFIDKLDKKKEEILNEEIDVVSKKLNSKFNILKEELNSLEEFNQKNINKLLNDKIIDIDNSVREFINNLTENYSNKYKDSSKKLAGNIINLKALTQKFNKKEEETSNKILSLKEKLEEKEDRKDNLSEKNKELLEFINEEFNTINNKFIYLNELENKKYNELLAAVSKKDVVEYKTILKEKIQDVEIGFIKEELKKELGDNFRNDIVSLKRYAEMTSGGGTVAKQFADGGTMNGTLDVFGNILSGGKNLDEIFNTDTSINLQDVTDIGNTTTNSISTNNTIIADTILATTLLSAGNLDIGFELSGFNVNGNISVTGNISACNLFVDDTDGKVDLCNNSLCFTNEGRDVRIEHKDCIGSSSANACNLIVNASDSASSGTGTAGCLILSAGSSSAPGGGGGNVIICAGAGNVNGGDIYLNADDTGYGTNGHIEMTSNIICLNAPNVRVETDSNFCVGTNGNACTNIRNGVIISQSLSASGGLSANNIKISGDILPSQTTSFNLGSSALRFKDIFLAGSTIDLSGTKISTDSEGDIEFRDASNLPKRLKASEIVLESSSDPNNDIVFKVNSEGNPEFEKRCRTNPNIIEPSITTTDVLSATQVRVDGLVGIGTGPNNPPNRRLTVVGNISATGNISTGSNLELGGNILDTDANELINIASNDITFVGKHIKSGFGLGVRDQRGCQKGMDCSSGSNTNNLGIFNCTIEAITVGTTGNVGIGTTTPNEALTVNGGISAADINSFGTISIGNTPAYSQTRAIKVHDNGTQYASRVSLMGTGDNAGPAIEFVTDGSLAKRTLIRHEGEGSNDYGLGFFTTNNGTISEKVRFDGDGNVGIGDTSPSYELDVNGTINAITRFRLNNQTFADFNSDTLRVGSSNAAHALALKAGAAERVTILSAGNVGIGTTTPNEALTVAGNTSAIGNVSFHGTLLGGDTNTNILSTCNNVILGGCNNEALGKHATVLNAVNGRASGDYSIVLNGRDYTPSSSTAGGAKGRNSILGAGPAGSSRYREARGIGSINFAGYNSSANANQSIVLGGAYNSTSLLASYSFVHGYRHQALAGNSVLLGGVYNTNSGYRTATLAGLFNTNSGSSSVMIGGCYSNNAPNSKNSVMVGGKYNNSLSAHSFIAGGYRNCSCNCFGGIIGGCYNTLNHKESIIAGSRITSQADCHTFVNNLSASCNIIGKDIQVCNNIAVNGGVEAGCFQYNGAGFDTCRSSFTLALSDNGKTIFLDTTNSTINVTTTKLVSGFSAKFIKDNGAAPVVFAASDGSVSGTSPISGLNSYQDRNQMSIIYSQADIFYKSDNYAFLGGNLQ